MGRASKHGSPRARNKPYRPRPALVGGGLQHFATGQARSDQRALEARLAQPLVADDVTHCSAKYWQALENLKMGVSTQQAWNYLATMANMTLGLCESGIGDEHTALVLPALESLNRAQLRAVNGRYRLDGDGIKAITEALELHEAQLKIATNIDILAAEAVLAMRVKMGATYASHA